MARAGESTMPSPRVADLRASGIASWRMTAIVTVGVALVAAGVAWMSMTPGGLAKDFTWPWIAANHVLAGRDPYFEMRATGQYPFNVPFYYPLPAALLATPFAPLPVSIAGIAFVAISFGVTALVLMRTSTHRVAVLLSFPALMAATLGQWSPLFLGATIAPALQFVLPVKPTLGIAAFVSRPSRFGAAASIILLATCFVIDPHWFASWRSAVAGALPTYTPPIRWAGGAGVVLLAVLVWWRDGDARLVAVMALAPQLPLFYDQLVLQAVARTKRETAILVSLSWVGGLIWAFQGPTVPGRERPATLPILLTLYLPALLVVAWRNLTINRKVES